MGVARARCSRCGKACPSCADSREQARQARLATYSNLHTALVSKMMREVAEEWGTTVDAMMGPSKKLRVYSARREAIRRLRYDFKWTLKEIGVLMDRNHSTVIHSLKAS